MPKNRDAFVDAYVIATGKKVRVPRHFFDQPALCKGLSKTPSQRAADAAGEQPSDAWTVKEIHAYAAEHDIDVPSDARKADLLAAITSAIAGDPTDLDNPDGIQPDDTTEPPAIGDQE